jgi:hypothetical protein
MGCTRCCGFDPGKVKLAEAVGQAVKRLCGFRPEVFHLNHELHGPHEPALLHADEAFARRAVVFFREVRGRL